jgi:hypothetical protein
MRQTLIFLIVIATSQLYAQVKSADEQIAETVRALPESLREGATVYGYSQSGEQELLRNGDNDMICYADNPFLSNDKGKVYVICFPKSLETYIARLAELKSSGISDDERFGIVAEEIKSGKIKMPDIAIRYTLRGHSHEGALPLTIVHVPFLTSEMNGFSVEIDNYRPWLMWGGTAHAHIMIPGH